jgi:hypothetical protein
MPLPGVSQSPHRPVNPSVTAYIASRSSLWKPNLRRIAADQGNETPNLESRPCQHQRCDQAVVTSAYNQNVYGVHSVSV